MQEKGEGHITSQACLPKTPNSSPILNTSGKFKLRDVQRNTCPVFLKTIKVVNNESLRKC